MERYGRVLSHFSCVQHFATPWTAAHQAPLSMGFSRQEYWSGLPCPPPGDLSDPGIEPVSLTSPSLAGGSSPLAPPGKPTWRGTEAKYQQLVPTCRHVGSESSSPHQTFRCCLPDQWLQPHMSPWDQRPPSLATPKLDPQKL